MYHGITINWVFERTSDIIFGEVGFVIFQVLYKVCCMFEECFILKEWELPKAVLVNFL